jgi:hypothetical protein
VQLYHDKDFNGMQHALWIIQRLRWWSGRLIAMNDSRERKYESRRVHAEIETAVQCADCRAAESSHRSHEKKKKKKVFWFWASQAGLTLPKTEKY